MIFEILTPAAVPSVVNNPISAYALFAFPVPLVIGIYVISDAAAPTVAVALVAPYWVGVP